jgi:uncharacterized membrane-anchored protein
MSAKSPRLTITVNEVIATIAILGLFVFAVRFASQDAAPAVAKQYPSTVSLQEKVQINLPKGLVFDSYSQAHMGVQFLGVRPADKEFNQSAIAYYRASDVADIKSTTTWDLHAVFLNPGCEAYQFPNEFESKQVTTEVK